MDNIPPDYLEDFRRQIETIAESTALMASTLPKEIAALSQKLTETFDVYKTAGPSRGEKVDHPGVGASDASSAGGGGTLGERDTVAAARKRLARGGDDAYEAEMEGDLHDTGPKSQSKWRDRVQLSGLGDILPLPRYPGAEPNARDLLNYMATVSANIAQKRQTTLDKSAAQHQVDYAKSQGIELDENGNLPDGAPPEVQARFDELGKAPETNLGRVSDLFGSLEGGYAQGRYITGILSKITRPLNNMRNLGYQTGYEGGNPGFLGLRLPWDSAVQQGFSQKYAEWKTALTQDVSPHQAGTIFNQLYQRGWLGGPKTDAMRSAAVQMMHQNPYVASMPDYYDMMDKATRMGVNSLREFNNTMSQVPDAAKAANTSIAQTMSDMQQIGEIVKQQGGTAQQGYGLSAAWQSVTGLPGASLAPALNNPLITGQTYMNTGLLPVEQGLASPGQRINSIMQVIGRMHGIINPPGAITAHDAGGFTRSIGQEDQRFALMSQFFPGWDRSTLQKLYHNQAGITAGANVWQELEDWQAASDASHSSKAANKLLGRTGSGDYGAIINAVKQAKYVDQNGQLKPMFSQPEQQAIKDIQKRDVYKYAPQAGAFHVPGYNKNVHLRDFTRRGSATLDALKAPIGYGDKGSLPAGVYKVGNQMYIHSYQSSTKAPTNTLVPSDATGSKVTKKELRDMAGGKAPLPKEVAKRIIWDRRWQAEQDIAKHTQSQSNPGSTAVTISLSKAAQKMFKLSDPTSANKAANNAGAINVNVNPYATGPTSAPTPDLNTAPNWTYDNTTSANGVGGM